MCEDAEFTGTNIEKNKNNENTTTTISKMGGKNLRAKFQFFMCTRLFQEVHQ